MARKGEQARDSLRASSVRPGGSRLVDSPLPQCQECGCSMDLYSDWKPIQLEVYGKRSLKGTCPNPDCNQEYTCVEPR